MFKKNISDGVGSQNESIDTPLDPPLFWLDNIFKQSQETLSLYYLKSSLLSEKNSVLITISA